MCPPTEFNAGIGSQPGGFQRSQLPVVPERNSSQADAGGIVDRVGDRGQHRLERGLPFRLLPGRLVLDLYDPVLLEQLMQFGPRPTPDQRLSLGHVRARLLALLRRADHVLCASARQRAFWLGWLGAAGRLGPGALSDDPAGRALVAIVPFGISEEPPQRGGAPLRSALAIPDTSKLALFWGGMWDWMDPALAVQAIAALRDQGRRVDLVLIAGARPGGVTMTLGAASARTAAAALAVEDRIHFLDRWIPYAERGGVLLEADVAVTAHHASLEAELAFRTRVLDCLWSGLPVASTRGDALAEDAEREGWGRCAETGDAAGLGEAIGRSSRPVRARQRESP